jgi:phosphoserine phosphatase
MLPAPVVQALDRVVRDHPGEPVVFDADGTLWRGDVGEDFLRFAVHHRHVHGSYDAYEQLLAKDPARAYGYCVEVMRGVEEAVIAKLCDDFFRERFTGRLFSFVRPLLKKLEDAGHPTWVCSASPWWNVVPGALALGIPKERVIGVTCPVENGVLTGVVDPPVPAGPGKVKWLERRGVKPALAVGNGDLDLDMLAFARTALVIAPPDSSNGLVAEGHRRGWPILKT